LNRVLLDQGISRTAAKILRETGWDALHTGDIGLSRATDQEILTYARLEKRVVITLDADFHAILAVQNAKSPSVVRIRHEGLKGPELANLIETIWPRIREQLESGAMVTVTRKSIRIRNIPITDKNTEAATGGMNVKLKT
jgi:predicted nuclease of predicted toxin-antitoxin system